MKALDRALLRKLLAMLGSNHDGEVLNAARRIDSLLKQADATWDTLLPDDDAPAKAGKSASENNKEDMERLEQLLRSTKVIDVLKIRLHGMKEDLHRGRLSAADRSLLRVLHRKAVIDGAVVSD